MIKAVLDTNVLISALIAPNGVPAMIVRHLAYFTFVSGTALLDELERVLRYDHIQRKYGLSEVILQEYAQRLRAVATLVTPEPKVSGVSRDPDDDKFLACALAASADYLVSGDRHLLELGEYSGIRIMVPAEFLALLADSLGVRE